MSNFENEEGRYQYNEAAKFLKPRLDLNDLLKRAENQKKVEKKTNLLIFSSAATAILLVVLLLNI